MIIRMLFLIMVALAGAHTGIEAAPAPDSGKGNGGRLLIERADRNIGYMTNGKLITELQGNVVLHYDSITIKAQNARLIREDGIVTLTDQITMSKGDQTMTCDRMTFQKQERMVTGSGKVVYSDQKNNIRLTGTEARYDLKNKELTISGSPLFQRFDPDAKDTMTVKGKYIIYNDSLCVASAQEQVVITKGKLRSTCDAARYFTRKERALLRGLPRIAFDLDNLDGDSVDLIFDHDTLKGIAVSGHAKGKYREASQKDTALTDITGDSMYMRINSKGNLDTLWTIGNVLSTYYPTLKADTANQISGKSMILAFNGITSDLDKVLVWGNARSTYFIQEQDSRGKNISSGDTIQVSFAGGKARNLTLAGSVRGTYYPQEN